MTWLQLGFKQWFTFFSRKKKVGGLFPQRLLRASLTSGSDAQGTSRERATGFCVWIVNGFCLWKRSVLPLKGVPGCPFRQKLFKKKKVMSEAWDSYLVDLLIYVFTWRSRTKLTQAASQSRGWDFLSLAWKMNGGCLHNREDQSFYTKS